MADYFPIEQAAEWLGDDGLVISALPHSLMQMLMIDWIGSEEGRFFFHYADYPDLGEDLYLAVSRNREPLYEIAARSPAPIILFGDNVDGFLVNPRLFQKFFMPEYEKQAKILHANGKLMAVHVVGRLDILKDLIAGTPIEIIEAFRPPPMGDLPVSEAFSLWRDKAVWLGFPGSVYSLGPGATRDYAIELLRGIAPGERVVFQMSTENIVSNENLLALTSVLQNAELPLTPERIERIWRLLRR